MSVRGRSVLACLAATAAFLLSSSAHGAMYDWKPLKVGGGGWITGIDISPDGTTHVIRTDTYGAYVWDTSANPDQWRQLVTTRSLPADEIQVEHGEGVYEIRVAPSAPARLYMAYDKRVYRSNDRGITWQRTPFAEVAEMNPNDGFRTWGEKMAVDPVNPDVVYVGTPRNGLFVTHDGGATWSQVAAVPAGTQRPEGSPGITGIAFDPSGGTSGNRTNIVYAASNDNGVWRSVDAGGNWSQIADGNAGARGGPKTVIHATVAGGLYYATSPEPLAGKPSSVWKHDGLRWTEIGPGGQYWHSVALDPLTPGRIVLASDGGYLRVSRDGGVSWDDVIYGVTRKSPEIPWLAVLEVSTYMSNGNMRFDPHQAGKLWFGEGGGVFHSQLGAGAQSSIEWTCQSVGIEQIVANTVVAPPAPNAKPVLASWDWALFTVTNPDAYATHHGPTNGFNAAWHVDWAGSDPNFLVAFVSDVRGMLGDESVYGAWSTDNGTTWTKFPRQPLDTKSPWDTFGFGTGAVSTPQNFVWVPSNKRAPYYTQDGAKTWHKVNLPGVADNPDGWTGLHWAYFLNRHIVTADRVTPGTFYMYHTPNGVYRSIDGGVTWQLVHAGELVSFSGFNAKLQAVPGRAGHLFFTAGGQAGLTPAGAFMRSVDAGTTWTPMPRVTEVYAFGFGKSLSGAEGYPSLFIVGWVDGVYGIWLSPDEGQSWEQIGDWPLSSLDEIKTIDGDKTVAGKVYVGFAGSGYAYGVAGGAGAGAGNGSGSSGGAAGGGGTTGGGSGGAPNVPSGGEPNVPSGGEPSVPSGGEPSVPSSPNVPSGGEPQAPAEPEPPAAGGGNGGGAGGGEAPPPAAPAEPLFSPFLLP